MLAHQDYWLPHVDAGLVIAMGPVADPAGRLGRRDRRRALVARSSRRWQAEDPAILGRARLRVTKTFRCRRSGSRPIEPLAPVSSDFTL